MIIVFAGYIVEPLMFYLGFYFVQHQLSFVYVGICLFFVIFHFTHTKQKWIPFILLIGLNLHLLFSRSKQGWDKYYLQQYTHIPQHL
ncbi:hypothetical protein [Staphylococcus epidermidis]|uniref:hypothetical protein n=1 Tax=Staphylococcus epidermidis TaxID=1282 RepID=UPI00030D98B1|nr:hypothetical protein [Staphylococcus epidermidis]